jgi:serine protease Do
MLCVFIIALSVNLQARSLPDFVDLVEANSAAVVNISTTQKAQASNPWANLDIPEHSPFNEFFKRFLGEGGMPPPPQDIKSLGSGFIISADGYIITNHHVVADADEILVRLSDKRELRAEVIGSDKYSDVALLKVDASDLPVVDIGSSEDTRVGQWVLAIGSPFGFDHSVTAGIISAKGRSLPRANYVPFIQTDVAINPGNSGGPLFDLNGKVVGINSQIYSRTGGFMGLSFAIPIEVAMEVVAQIKNKGSVSRGWLGVYIQHVTQGIAESFGLDKPVGALVSQVIANSPAQKYGIQAGDVIVAFNGKKITDSTDLPPLVGRVPVGDKAKVKVLREGRYKTLNVVIEKLQEQGAEPVLSQNRSLRANRLGLEVTDLNASSKAELGRGVRIVQVQQNSVAHRAGLRAGDVILQINQQNIKNIAEFRSQVARLPTGRMIPALVQRNGANQYVVLRILAK